MPTGLEVSLQTCGHIFYIVHFMLKLLHTQLYIYIYIYIYVL